MLAGGSAGAVCWFEGGTTSSFGPEISAVPDGLGLLPGSLAVHYDSDPARRPAHQAAVAAGLLPPGWALDEGTGLVFRGAELTEVLAERPGRAVWRVERDGDSARETRIQPRRLQADPAS